MSGERVTPNLTQIEAEARASSIKTGLNYKIFIDFREGESYSGLIRIEFKLFNTDNVFVDYCGDAVELITLNGKEIDPASVYEIPKGRITLPKEELCVEGINTLHIKFSNRYYTDGNGIQTYTDVDGSQYLYTQSEAYWGNRVMPLFDQPDLKAKYVLHAATPVAWKVLSSAECEYTETWSQFVAGDYGSDYYRLIRSHFAKSVPEEHLYWQFSTT